MNPSGEHEQRTGLRQRDQRWSAFGSAGDCREHAKRYYTSPKGQELFFATLFTPNRVALRFRIQKIISWANVGVRRD